MHTAGRISNVTENVDKISFAYDIVSRAMSPFVLSNYFSPCYILKLK